MLSHLSEILKFVKWRIFTHTLSMDGVNFKSDFTQTFPDTLSNQQYAIFMCEKPLWYLMIPQTNVVFLGLPDYKVLDIEGKILKAFIRSFP